jgi:hypothetical protein
MDTPEKIVSQLARRRNFEGNGVYAERIERTKNLSNRPVLAARVRALQNDQYCVLCLRIENFLQPVDLADVGGGLRIGL